MSAEDKKWELSLFQILRVCGNVYYLADDRHSYTDILLYISKLRDRGLVIKTDDQLRLTKDGQIYYRQLCRSLGKRGLYKYLMESNDKRIPSLALDDIYVPRKRLNL